MEWFFNKLSSTFQQFIPTVRADDSDEEQDPQVILRAQCEKKECTAYLEKLETCNQRVRSKKKTTESCHEEMIDFIHCLDHCTAKTLFTKLNFEEKLQKLTRLLKYY